jgi:hypothetical protein
MIQQRCVVLILAAAMQMKMLVAIMANLAILLIIALIVLGSFIAH